MELGGKSAAIICEDANLDETVPGLIMSSMLNNGQACVAQTRILRAAGRQDEVTDRLVAAVEALKVGDPLDPATEVGPLVAERQRDRVEGYLKLGQEGGAKFATGGGRPDFDQGWYVQPTVFVGVDNGMRIMQEEIFGPVIGIIPYEDEADALRIANDSHYGLSGTVWTADVDHGIDIARQVRTGTYTVNGFMIEFGCPFGGYKESGLGRELGPEGLDAYLRASRSACRPATRCRPRNERGPVMDESAARALLEEFGQAWNDHDLDRAIELTTPDCVFESTGPAPDGERAVGQAAVRAAWTPIFADAAADFEVEELIVQGDRASQCWTYRWADGHVRGIDLFALRDGLVAEKLSYVKG